MNEHKEYPLNEKLLEETIHLIERWKVTQDRCNKIDEHKPKVSDSVYKRVKTDYEDRLNQASEELKAKKLEIDTEISMLEESRAAAEAQLLENKNALEEFQLRNKLGEFSDDEFKKSTAEKKEKIDKLTEVLASIDEGIKRYNSLFEGVGLEPTSKPKGKARAESTEEAEPQTGRTEPEVIQAEGINESFASLTDPDIAINVTKKATVQELEEDTAKSQVVAHLTITDGKNAGEVHELQAKTSIGRAESNTITIADARASRQHARIEKQGEEYIVVDLHSSNGTFVNGQRIDEYVLAPGDEIQIGDTKFEFQQ